MRKCEPMPLYPGTGILAVLKFFFALVFIGNTYEMVEAFVLTDTL